LLTKNRIPEEKRMKLEKENERNEKKQKTLLNTYLFAKSSKN
jgi:hypothetical protein